MEILRLAYHATAISLLADPLQSLEMAETAMSQALLAPVSQNKAQSAVCLTLGLHPVPPDLIVPRTDRRRPDCRPYIKEWPVHAKTSNPHISSKCCRALTRMPGRRGCRKVRACSQAAVAASRAAISTVVLRKDLAPCLLSLEIKHWAQMADQKVRSRGHLRRVQDARKVLPQETSTQTA